MNIAIRLLKANSGNFIAKVFRGKDIDMISNTDHLLLIKIEHGFWLDLIPIALQRLADKIILGLERAVFDNVSKVSGLSNSEETSNTDTPLLLSEITLSLYKAFYSPHYCYSTWMKNHCVRSPVN